MSVVLLICVGGIRTAGTRWLWAAGAAALLQSAGPRHSPGSATVTVPSPYPAICTSRTGWPSLPAVSHASAVPGAIGRAPTWAISIPNSLLSAPYTTVHSVPISSATDAPVPASSAGSLSSSSSITGAVQLYSQPRSPATTITTDPASTYASLPAAHSARADFLIFPESFAAAAVFLSAFSSPSSGNMEVYCLSC